MLRKNQVVFSLEGFLTRLSFPIFTSSSPSRVISFMWMVMEKTEWERLHTSIPHVIGNRSIGEERVLFLTCAFTWSRRS